MVSNAAFEPPALVARKVARSILGWASARAVYFFSHASFKLYCA
jgi:hypothetical protein